MFISEFEISKLDGKGEELTTRPLVGAINCSISESPPFEEGGDWIGSVAYSSGSVFA